MPHPLSNICDEGEVNFSSTSLRDSIFAADIAYVIALWAEIDGDIATILSRMLKADIAVGSAMYMALIGSGSRKSALKAAAQQALPEWQALLLDAIERETEPSRRERNAFAHHVWGVCLKIPEAVLLTEPKTIVEFNISHRQIDRIESGSNVIAPKPLDRSKIAVYRQPDIDRAVSRAEEARKLYRYFYMSLIVRERYSYPVEEMLRFSPLKELSEHPGVRGHLKKIAKSIRLGDPETKSLLGLE